MLITQQLKLTPNPVGQTDSCVGSMFRYEYGDRHKLLVIFSARPKGAFQARKMFEADFAKARKQCEIFIGGIADPMRAIKLLRKAYPHATILMRLDPLE